MERLNLTQEEQALIEVHRAELGTTSETVIVDGSNLKLGDHLQIDNSWEGVVVGPEAGTVSFYVPAWPLLFPVDLFDYITDRAGPNGETMPVTDPAPQARGAAAAAPAATPDKHHKPHRRHIKEVLREAIKRLPHDQQKNAREVMVRAGVLGKDDK